MNFDHLLSIAQALIPAALAAFAVRAAVEDLLDIALFQRVQKRFPNANELATIFVNDVATKLAVSAFVSALAVSYAATGSVRQAFVNAILAALAADAGQQEADILAKVKALFAKPVAAPALVKASRAGK